ncbi:hypothetical protein J8V57_13570 [Xenorhabdus sp. PB61.4]|uniref:hypothetical protein n=1 Tax=Xenorhabdus sp. PB61.4 TaxID=2788940 RepID=UPI001E2AF5C0|nr:hypothetical protein [Xenorhabdus sp. PB61.4]MCC8367284.1 hypothetical protein [Xenorhabdus sp. PB61.4]
MAPTKSDALGKALDDQKAGKNLVQASKDIVRLTNEDKASNVLLEQYRNGQLNDGEKQQLATLLDQYGFELQTEYGFTRMEAANAIQTLVKGGAFVATAADAKAYNDALSYLKMYSIQSGQAIIGADALMVLPGNPGLLARGTLMAGGAHQAGTGIGQMIDGQYVEGVTNVGLGSLAIFGGASANKVVTQPTKGIVSPDKLVTQESSRVLDRRVDAQHQLDNFAKSFADRKYKPATAIAAVDPLTGRISTASNGAVPSVIAPELLEYAQKLGGLGVKTACGNTLGRCAEFRAANELMLSNPNLKVKDIQFTPAVRPRTGEVVPRCDNCTNMFGAE